MILTCPQCASRYRVGDGTIPPQGRTVRCAGCGTSWRAEPPEADDPPLQLHPAEPEPAPAKPAAGAIPLEIRAKNQARQRTQQAAVAGAVWGVLGVLVLALLGGAYLFRVDMVRLWPRTAGAYAKVGLPVNPTGLAPEDIQAGPGLKDGHAAVLVTGVVRNVETRPHAPAPLRITLLDKAGQPLVRQVLKLDGAPIRPGQTRPFSATFLDPPSAAANIQVEFALDPAGPEVAAEDMRLRGPAAPPLPPMPAPREATPLPPGSPHALPPAAEANTHHLHEG